MFFVLLFVQFGIVIRWIEFFQVSFKEIDAHISRFKDVFSTTENYKLKIEEIKKLLV
jgi:hypothetical protein